jgi:hypothetical protein
MDDKVTRELLDELLSALERLETQNLAVLQFLKDQKKGADKLAPYLEQAEKASGVKWMATRARLNHLLERAAGEAERAAEKSAETQAKSVEPAMKVEENSQSEAAQSREAPPEKPEKVEGSEKTSEPRKPEPAFRTGEISSAENQAGTKPSNDKQTDHTTESV